MSSSSVASAMQLQHVIMAGDIGGTNSRLRLFLVNPSVGSAWRKGTPAPGELLFEQKYPNFDYSSLVEVLERFLMESAAALEAHPALQFSGGKGGSASRVHCDICCLAVAGVVTDNQCRLTNLDWPVDGHDIQQRFGMARVEVINDFVAQGYGILTLRDGEVTALNGAVPREGAPIACLGAGTGLGECYLTLGPSGGYECYPSEGGHAEWAPRDEGSDDTQLKLLQHLKIKFSQRNRVSVERVVSGPGLCNIYEYLAFTQPRRVARAVHRQYNKLKTLNQHAPVISMNATPGSLCDEALNIFAACYGAEAGVLALKFMPFGGIYLTGGVTTKPQVRARLEDEEGYFMDAYTDKGRVSPFLPRVPLFIVNIEDMGERGAHLRAVNLSWELAQGLPQPAPPRSAVAQDELVPPKDMTMALLKSKL